jgi:hypothetical protein
MGLGPAGVQPRPDRRRCAELLRSATYRRLTSFERLELHYCYRWRITQEARCAHTLKLFAELATSSLRFLERLHSRYLQL